jgi:hypothetical protein
VFIFVDGKVDQFVGHQVFAHPLRHARNDWVIFPVLLNIIQNLQVRFSVVLIAPEQYHVVSRFPFAFIGGRVDYREHCTTSLILDYILQVLFTHHCIPDFVTFKLLLYEMEVTACQFGGILFSRLIAIVHYQHALAVVDTGFAHSN